MLFHQNNKTWKKQDNLLVIGIEMTSTKNLYYHYSSIIWFDLDCSYPLIVMVCPLAQKNGQRWERRAKAISVHMRLVLEILTEEGKNKTVDLHCFKKVIKQLSNQIVCSFEQLDFNQTVYLPRMAYYIFLCPTILNYYYYIIIFIQSP